MNSQAQLNSQQNSTVVPAPPSQQLQLHIQPPQPQQHQHQPQQNHLMEQHTYNPSFSQHRGRGGRGGRGGNNRNYNSSQNQGPRPVYYVNRGGSRSNFHNQNLQQMPQTSRNGMSPEPRLSWNAMVEDSSPALLPPPQRQGSGQVVSNWQAGTSLPPNELPAIENLSIRSGPNTSSLNFSARSLNDSGVASNSSMTYSPPQQVQQMARPQMGPSQNQHNLVPYPAPPPSPFLPYCPPTNQPIGPCPSLPFMSNYGPFMPPYFNPYVMGPFGPYGPLGAYGQQGPYGPQGSYNPQDPYGQQGAYGPQGIPYTQVPPQLVVCSVCRKSPIETGNASTQTENLEFGNGNLVNGVDESNGGGDGGNNGDN